MNLVKLRKLLVFAMVVIPIMSFSLTMEVGVLPLILAWLALPVAWFWEAPRVDVDRFDGFWTVVTVGVFVGLAGASLFAGLGFLFAVIYFVLFLSVSRLFQRKATRDHIQAMAMSLVMVAAAGVFNDGLSFAFFFTVYAVLATIALTVHHLHVEIGDHHGRDVATTRVEPRILQATAALAVVILALAFVFFFTFPRIGFGFFSIGERSGLQTSGFAENVELGFHGTIRTDNSVVMRIRFPDAPPVDPQSLYMRGMALDTFDGRSWSHDVQERLPTRRVEGGVLVGQELSDRLRDDDTSFGDLVAPFPAAEVYLQPLDTDVLFGVNGPIRGLRLTTDTGMPDMIFGRSFSARWSDRVDLSARSEHGVAYLAWSDLQQRPSEQLRGERWPGGHDSLAEALESRFTSVSGFVSDDPAVVGGVRARAREHRLDGSEMLDLLHAWAFYTQLPDGVVTPRMRERLDELQASASSTYDFVSAVEGWLASDFEWTVDIPRPSSRSANVVDEFLFNWQRGHCEYFATAMVILLRAEGIPARIVNGFLGSEYNGVGNYFTVRQSNAHSWVEVLFPESGWVRFEPTPASATAGGRGLALLRTLDEFFDNLRMLWFQWIVEYDMEKQFSLARDIVDTLRGEESRAGSSPEVSQQLRAAGRWLWGRARALGWILTLTVVGVLLLRRRAQHRLPFGRGDLTITVGWALLSLAGTAVLWPRGLGVAALLFALVPPLVGGVLAFLARRLLLGDDGAGRRRRSTAGQAEITRWMQGLVLEAERAGAWAGPSVSFRETLEQAGVGDPEIAAEVAQVLRLYEAVRFGGRELMPEERRAWRGRIRALRKRLKAARRKG